MNPSLRFIFPAPVKLMVSAGATINRAVGGVSNNKGEIHAKVIH